MRAVWAFAVLFFVPMGAEALDLQRDGLVLVLRKEGLPRAVTEDEQEVHLATELSVTNGHGDLDVALSHRQLIGVQEGGDKFFGCSAHVTDHGLGCWVVRHVTLPRVEETAETELGVSGVMRLARIVALSFAVEPDQLIPESLGTFNVCHVFPRSSPHVHRPPSP